MRVALIGLRGTGKTTLGAPLADALGEPFLDGDAVLEDRTGCTIAELMAETTFREREWAVTQSLLASPSAVIAFGGGAAMHPQFGVAAAGWTVILLTADPTVLAERMRASDVARPSLTGAAPGDEIEAVWQSRRNHYEALADFSASTDTLDVRSVLATLVAKLH